MLYILHVPTRVTHMQFTRSGERCNWDTQIRLIYISEHSIQTCGNGRRDSPESWLAAHHFAHLAAIPACQRCYQRPTTIKLLGTHRKVTQSVPQWLLHTFLEILAEIDRHPTVAQLVTEAEQNSLIVATLTAIFL